MSAPVPLAVHRQGTFRDTAPTKVLLRGAQHALSASGPCLTWSELEVATPEIAALGRDLLERFQFVLVGTLTKDGSPRVNPCEAYVIDGHLLLNMMPRSLKALDLLRDPRSRGAGCPRRGTFAKRGRVGATWQLPQAPGHHG